MGLEPPKAEIINPQLNLKRYVDGDIYAGMVLLNDSPYSVDSTQYEYNLGVFSNVFDGGDATPGNDWPIELPNSHGLIQLVGLAGSSTTAMKPLGGYGEVGLTIGFDSDSDGGMDSQFGSYRHNWATISDVCGIQTIPGVNLTYDPTASSVIRKTYNRALPEFVGTHDYVILSERIPKRPTYYKYGAYYDRELDRVVDSQERTFSCGFDNGLYVDQEGKIKVVSTGYTFHIQPPLYSIFSLFDKFLFNENGIQTDGIEYNGIFDPSSENFVPETVGWAGDEEDAYLGFDHNQRITKYLLEPHANVKHLFRLFLNKKFKDKYDEGHPDWSHLASAVEYYDPELKIKSLALAGNELAILLDEEGKIHVISNATPASFTNTAAQTASYASTESFISELMVWYPEKYRKSDWSDHLDSNGVPNDLDTFPYMSSEKYFWLDDSGELLDTENVVFVSVQATGSTLTGEGITLFAIDDQGKVYTREIKSTVTGAKVRVPIPNTNGETYLKYTERTKYTSYDSEGIPSSDLDPQFMRGGRNDFTTVSGDVITVAYPSMGFDDLLLHGMRSVLTEIGYTFPADPTDPNAEDLPINNSQVNREFTKYLINGDPWRVAGKYRDITKPESIMIDPVTEVPMHEDNSIMRFLTAALRQIPKDSNGRRCPVFQITDTFEHLSAVVYADLSDESLGPLIVSETEVVPNYKPGLMHLGSLQLEHGNLMVSLAKKLSPRLAVHTFSSGVDPLDDSAWSYIENTSAVEDKTISFDEINYRKLFMRTVGNLDYYIPPRGIGGTRSGIMIHSNNDKIAYITAKQWKDIEYIEPSVTDLQGNVNYGDGIDIDFFVSPHPTYFKLRGLQVVPDYEPWKTYNNKDFLNLFFNRGNLKDWSFLPNSRIGHVKGINLATPDWDDKLYPSKTDPNYDENSGIPMMGSCNGNMGQFFGVNGCYPGFCNPPYIFPPYPPGTLPGEPGELEPPGGILGPYLPGIPPHQPGGLLAYYDGISTVGESGGGQEEYGSVNSFMSVGLGATEPDWDLLDQNFGGRAETRILDTSLFDEEGNPYVDIRRNFSFWENSGRLSSDIPEELTDDPLYLRDWRIPNSINERNFINESNLECIPYPDSMGREYLRSNFYRLNSANLTILDAELADGSGRTIEYATAHADIYYIILSDGSVRAMTYRIADSDSLVWYPARGPYDRDVTRPRMGLMGENSLSIDKEITAFNKTMTESTKTKSQATQKQASEVSPKTSSTKTSSGNGY